MGNIGSSRSSRRRHRIHPPRQPPQPEITAAATHSSITAVVPGPNSQLFSPDSTVQLSCEEPPQQTVTVRNDVNIKKETLRIEPDQQNPGNFLVAFTFDATAPGSITVMFFAKETTDGKLVAVRQSMLKEVSMPFQQGLCQNFRQPSGTGFDFSILEEEETVPTKGDIEVVYPLVLKADAQPLNNGETDGAAVSNCQITLARFDKGERGEYGVQVLKQILWINGKRYELQEIYGIGNAGDCEFDGQESGRECVICLTEPRDITVLPCRHMCMCSGCAKLLRDHTDNCPICRHPVERFLEMKVNNESSDS